MKLNAIQLVYLLLALFMASTYALPIASVDDDATVLARELAAGAADSADLVARVTVHDSHWNTFRIPEHIRPWTEQEIEAQEIEASLKFGNATATVYNPGSVIVSLPKHGDTTSPGSTTVSKRSWLSHVLKGTQKCLQCGACKVGWDYSAECKDDCSYCKDGHSD